MHPFGLMVRALTTSRAWRLGRIFRTIREPARTKSFSGDSRPDGATGATIACPLHKYSRTCPVLRMGCPHPTPSARVPCPRTTTAHHPASPNGLTCGSSPFWGRVWLGDTGTEVALSPARCHTLGGCSVVELKLEPPRLKRRSSPGIRVAVDAGRTAETEEDPAAAPRADVSLDWRTGVLAVQGSRVVEPTAGVTRDRAGRVW